MSHEWNPQNEKNYLEEMLDNGRSLDVVSRALAKDAVAHDHEFILKQTLIPFDYEINEEGRWTDSGGKTIEELTDPDDVGADRLDRVLAAEKAMMNDDSIEMAAVASPDLGYGRNYIYLYSRGEGNTIQALAVEFHGNDETLGDFFRGLGVKGGADVSESDNFEKPLLFFRTVTPEEILQEAKETVAATDEGAEYLARLSRDVSVFPLILRERERQVAEMASIALDHMIAEDDVREGLAAAVYGVIALSSETAEVVAYNIVDDTRETIVGVVDYMKRQHAPEIVEESSVSYEAPTYTRNLEDVIHKGNLTVMLAITTEPASPGFSLLTEPEKVEVWTQTVRDVLGVSEEQSEHLYIEVREMWETFEEANEIRSLATALVQESSSVGVPAALFALDTFTLTPHEGLLGEGVFLMPAEERLGGKDAVTSKGNANETDQVGAHVFDLFFMMMSEGIRKQPEAETNPKLVEVSESVDVQTFVRSIRFLEGIDALPVKDQKEAIAREKKRVEQSLVMLFGETQRLVSAPDVSEGAFLPEPIKRERYEISRFSLALALWMTLKLMSYHATLESLESFLAAPGDMRTEGKNMKEVGLLARVRERHPEGLIQREFGQWLLLAIIWHLSMIREQGMQTTKAGANKKQTKKHKKTVTATTIMPMYGVIFAYGS